MEHVKNTNLYDYFYVYAPEYYVWPLEVHYINFLLHVSENQLKMILKMVKIYISKNAAFDGFSKDFKDFKKLCIEELKNIMICHSLRKKRT